MTENILVSVIGGLCVAIPSLIATITQNKKSTSLITYRVDRLEKKVEKHNTIIERTYILEEKVNEIKNDIKEIKRK